MDMERVGEIVAGIKAINDGKDKTCNHGEDLAPHGIAGYARHAAVSELIENWDAAISEGRSLRSLVGDVQDVIVDLRKFRQAVKFRFAKEMDLKDPALGARFSPRLHAINDGKDETCHNGEDLAPGQLCEYARHAAVKQLLDNWTQALSTRHSLGGLIGDVEDVIAELKQFREAVNFRFAADLDATVERGLTP